MNNGFRGIAVDNKKTRHSGRVLFDSLVRNLDRDDVLGLGSLLAIGDRELHLLTFGE